MSNVSDTSDASEWGSSSGGDSQTPLEHPFYAFYVTFMTINFFAMIGTLLLFLPTLHRGRPRFFIALPVIAVTVLSILICLYHTTTLLSHDLFWFSLVFTPCLVIGPLFVRSYLVWHVEMVRPLVPGKAPRIPYRLVYLSFAVFVFIHILTAAIAVFTLRNSGEDTAVYYYILFVDILVYLLGACVSLYTLSRMQRRGSVRYELIILLVGAVIFIMPVIIIDIRTELYSRIEEYVPVDVFFFLYTWVIYGAALVPVLRDIKLPRSLMTRFHRLSMLCCRAKYQTVDDEFQAPDASTAPGSVTLKREEARAIRDAADALANEPPNDAYLTVKPKFTDSSVHLSVLSLYYLSREYERFMTQCNLEHHLHCLFLLQELIRSAEREDDDLDRRWKRLYNTYFDTDSPLRGAVDYEQFVQPIHTLPPGSYPAMASRLQELSTHLTFIVTHASSRTFISLVRRYGYIDVIPTLRSDPNRASSSTDVEEYAERYSKDAAVFIASTSP